MYFSGCEDVNDESFEPKVRLKPSKLIKEVWQTIEEENDVNNTSTDVIVDMDFDSDQNRYVHYIVTQSSPAKPCVLLLEHSTPLPSPYLV